MAAIDTDKSTEELAGRKRSISSALQVDNNNAKSHERDAGDGKPKKMLIFGHRGASHTHPENTQASIIAALESLAHGFEIDVQRTKDSSVVVLHDENMERTSTNSGIAQDAFDRLVKMNVNELNFDELRDIDIGSWKHQDFSDQRLSSLEEVLDVLSAHPDKACLTEIKGGDISIIPIIKSIIDVKKTPPSQLIFIGFDAETMTATKETMPEYRVYRVVHESFCTSTEGIYGIIDLTCEQGLDGVDFPADASFVTSEVVQYSHSKGLDVAVWVSKSIPGSDSKATWDAMQANEVDIFTSDLPDDIFSSESGVF